MLCQICTDASMCILPPMQGFHVFKVVEGMPAAQCGQIVVGDRILQVRHCWIINTTDTETIACTLAVYT